MNKIRRAIIICLTATVAIIMSCAAVSAASLTTASSSGGTVSLSVSQASSGATVTGNVKPDEGYDAATVRVESGGNTTFATLDGTSFSFSMPSGDAKVTAAFFSTKVWDGAVDISWYDPTKTEYEIGEPAELAGLAALVNGLTDVDTPKYMIKGDTSLIKSESFPDILLVGAGGGNVSSTVYSCRTDFAYKTVKLTADLNMGGVYNTGTQKWSGPNYTPVGGKYCMDTDQVEGDPYVIDTRFNGVFDGQGHTVSNIYCQRYADKGFPYSMAIGLVGFLGGESDTGTVSSTFDNGWQPTVKNVVVGSGYIYGRRMVGGVVGRVGDTNNGVVIENCGNHADIKNTDSKGVGGIVGAGNGDGVIRNCYNTGSVTTTFVCPAGGICGTNGGMDIYNCYNVGKINSNGAIRGRGIGAHDSGIYTVGNCFSLKGCDDDPDSEGYYVGSNKRITVNVTEMNESQMKGTSMLDALNASGNVFVVGDASNGGYPVLYFESSGFDSTKAYGVTVKQSSGGNVTVYPDGTATAGQVVSFSSKTEAGYKLDYYTVNGVKTDADFYIASGDMEVSASFSKVRTANISLPSSDVYSIVVTMTGYELVNGETVEILNKPVKNGDTVLEDNVITVRSAVYPGKSPSDKNKEYTGVCTYTASNTETKLNGVFRVTGAGDVEIAVTPTEQDKSWITIADTSWYKVKNDTFTLTTPEQLAGLAALVNLNGLTFEGKTILLGNDISLVNTDGTKGIRTWKPIGTTSAKSFRGTFDGKGYTVSDMTAQREGSYSALFGYCTNAVISNLTVKGTSSCTANIAYAGGIASYIAGTKIENCVNRVTVSVAGENAGGIASYISEGSQIISCTNYGSITAGTGVGGIVGICQSTADVIKDCVNVGSLEATGTSGSGCGGIAAKLNGTITGCINAGEVSGTDRYMGGIAGYTCGRNTSTLKDSQNAGTVTSKCSNQSAALGGVVGYAQYLTMDGCSNIGKVIAGSGFSTEYIGALMGRPGTELCTASNCEYTGTSSKWAAAKGDYTGVTVNSAVAAKDYETVPDTNSTNAGNGPYKATFIANGNVVATVEYIGSITAPAVPEKAGFKGVWPSFEACGRDFSVTAVYIPDAVCGGTTISASGTYYLQHYAAGELVIADGVQVKLIGTDRTLGALTIKVGNGSKLTLENVEISGETTLMTFAGDAELTLNGVNKLTGSCDLKENENPTVTAKGNLTISGNGSLYVQSAINNAAVYIAPGKTLEVKSGLLSVYKTDLLGMDGGALYAIDASVKLSGGSIEGRTTSDNVNVIAAQTLSLNSGSINAAASKSSKVINASSMNLSGGLVRALGHSGNSSADNRYYYSAEAIQGTAGSVNYYNETKSFGQAVLSPQNIVADGKNVSMEVYNIDGSNYFKLRDIAGLMEDTKASFSVGFSGELMSMYTVKGASYEPAGGELLTGTDKSSTCTPSSWVLFVNGKLVNCMVYNIGGNNFFKLRDLGDAFGFGVSFDQSTNTATLAS